MFVVQDANRPAGCHYLYLRDGVSQAAPLLTRVLAFFFILKCQYVRGEYAPF